MDQMIAVDARSRGRHRRDRAPPWRRGPRGGRAAARSSARVLGKGDAMWRALSVARGDIVMFPDADTANFGAHFVYGLLGPLLARARRCGS